MPGPLLVDARETAATKAVLGPALRVLPALQHPPVVSPLELSRASSLGASHVVSFTAVDTLPPTERDAQERPGTLV